MSMMLMSNIILGLLCIGVIVQTMRLMRRLRAMADGQMGAIVIALNRATEEARTVLDGLRRTLGGEGADLANCVNAARDLRDELSVMIGIANAMAERLVEARSTGAPPPAEEARQTEDTSPPSRRRTTKVKTSSVKRSTRPKRPKTTDINDGTSVAVPPELPPPPPEIARKKAA